MSYIWNVTVGSVKSSSLWSGQTDFQDFSSGYFQGLWSFFKVLVYGKNWEIFPSQTQKLPLPPAIPSLDALLNNNKNAGHADVNSLLASLPASWGF